MSTVIFACIHNAGRSQMAAAWSDAMVPNFGVLYSNGTAKPSYTRYQALAVP